MTDDMQRYREIQESADPDEPVDKLRRYLVVASDQALAEAIRLEQQGKPGKVRALGFTETAEVLEGLLAPQHASDPSCVECNPAPVTFRCRELGHTVRPN